MRRHKFTLGSLVIAAGLIYLFIAGVQQSTATHMTLQILMDRAVDKGQRIQLGGGTVVPGSIEWDRYRSRPEFGLPTGNTHCGCATSDTQCCPIPSKTRQW